MREAITIRSSTDADYWRIASLAALDDRPVPHGEVLLAFVDGSLRAALPLSGGHAIADPFYRTEQVVALLRFRARQEHDLSFDGRGPQGGRPWRLHAGPAGAAA